MKSIILTKWVEPYKLLETIKEISTFKDFTFDGISKSIEKKKFLKELNKNETSIGLYMKNVNKYYMFTECKTEIWPKLCNDFKLTETDYEISEDIENKPFELVDLGKAEAILILR